MMNINQLSNFNYQSEAIPIFKMLSIKSIRKLRMLMPIIAMISLLTQSIAIITNDWLHTVESMPNSNYEKFTMPAELEFYHKSTSSGLWTLCYNEPPDTSIVCMKIDHFSNEEYIPDQNDSTMAIPYAVKQAAIYFLISTGLMIIGQSIYLISQLCRWRRIYIFISGIPFILSGLLVLTGIVVYISTFKNEVGYKLRPISQFQDALFDYRYGYSFLFLVTSLLLSQLTGTLAIFLYVSQKHFKIIIDSERDEVLENNIINLLRIQQQQQQQQQQFELQQQQQQRKMNCPKFRIISVDDVDDEVDDGQNFENLNIFGLGGGGVGGLGADLMAPIQSPNFLHKDPNLLDTAFYQCGRHGTRGRRNSRSNDSYLSSPRESTCLESLKSTLKSSNYFFDEQLSNNQIYPTKSIVSSNENFVNDANVVDVDNENDQLQELNVQNLLQQIVTNPITNQNQYAKTMKSVSKAAKQPNKSINKSTFV